MSYDNGIPDALWLAPQLVSLFLFNHSPSLSHSTGHLLSIDFSFSLQQEQRRPEDEERQRDEEESRNEQEEHSKVEARYSPYRENE